jgi:hypothetical protein
VHLGVDLPLLLGATFVCSSRFLISPLRGCFTQSQDLLMPGETMFPLVHVRGAPRYSLIAFVRGPLTAIRASIPFVRPLISEPATAVGLDVDLILLSDSSQQRVRIGQRGLGHAHYGHDARSLPWSLRGRY